MRFRTEIQLQESKIKIRYEEKIFLLGSCFAENIGARLHQLKYKVAINPLGIIYHPLPLHDSVIQALHGQIIGHSDLNKNHEGQHTVWQAHSQLCGSTPSITVDNVNTGIQKIANWITTADHIILTYGTAFYYNHKEHGPVANCHKFPNSNFDKKLSSPNALVDSFGDMYQAIKKANPNVNIFLTVSPVRHIKDGIIENSRSKAHLITAVHEICETYDDCHYLPSYEIQLDDLRDYRYYNDDMVHPTNKAIDYIWHKMEGHLLDSNEANLRKDILKIVRAASHRPFNPDSEQHHDFKAQQIKSVQKIKAKYADLDFTEELKVFES